MKTMFYLKKGIRSLLYPFFFGAGLTAAHAQLSSFTHTYVAANGMSRVDRNNSHMIITPYYGSDNYKPGYLMASNIESNGALFVKVTAIHPSTGAQVWSRMYQGTDGLSYGNTRCFAISYDRRDNGYVLTGYRNNPNTRRDELWLMKIDAEGNTLNDFSFSADSIPCTYNGGALERPCQTFYEPSFYGMDILQVSQDPDTLKNDDFVVTGFLSSKPAVGDYGVSKRSFVWRFRYSRLSGSSTPGILTRYMKVFHCGSLRTLNPQPTSEDYTYELQEIPQYGLMLLGHIPATSLVSDPAVLSRQPYYALLNYDGGAASTLHSDVFRYANYTATTKVKHVRTLLGKDGIIYMLGYYYPTHSFTITPMKPRSGGVGLTRIYFAQNIADLPAFSMFQSRNNSDELVVMGYRLGINEPVRTDFIHPYTIKISKGGQILSRFNLEAIRSPQYTNYTPADPGGTDYFRPFEKVFPLAATPEIGLLNNHTGNNDAVATGVLYRGFTSGIERFHATVSQFNNITSPAECHPYQLSPDQDSVQLTYNALTFNINNAEFTATRYRTLVTDASSEYGCADIPLQKGASAGVTPEMAAGDFSLYPNPAHDQIMIRYSGDDKETQLNIQDVTGRVIYTAEKVVLGQQPYMINLTQYPAGIYIIAISDNNGLSQRFKVVKE